MVGRKFILKLPFHLDLAGLKKSLKNSLFLLPKIFLGTVSSEADKLILGKMNNSGGVGFYNIAQKFSYPIYMFMVALQNKWSPQVYKYMYEGKENSGQVIGKYLTPYLYFSIAVSMFVVSFSEEACKILLPSSYTIVPELICIFAMINSLRFFSMQPQLMFAKKTGLISIFTLSSIALSLIIVYPMVVYFGVRGAAWGFLIGVFINAIIFFQISQYHYRVYWELSKILIIYGIFFLSAISTILLIQTESNYLIRLGLKLLLLGGFLLFGFRLKYLGISNMKRLFQ
jgi:O-antigen/teichoic acid export membrane protein